MAEGSVDPTTEARDKFWELGTPLISRRLAFQGPDIDPYLRYAIEVDVECMVQEHGALMGLDSLSAGTSSRAATSSRPALPENVVSFDSEGMMLGRLLSFKLDFYTGEVMVSVCFRFCEEPGSVWQQRSWENHSFAVFEGV